MPYRRTWEPFGVYREYFGDVTIAERRALFDAVCGDRRFDDLRYASTDCLAVRAYEVSCEATAEIAALHIGTLHTDPALVMAGVTDRMDVIAAIEDFKCHAFTAAPYRVFRTLPEVRHWVSGRAP